MPISLIILLIVLLLITFRNIGPVNLPIWLSMLAGALAVLVTQQIDLDQAWHAINWNIIGYLVGVFIIGQALEDSGLLYRFSERLFAHAHYGWSFTLTMVFSFGLLSALLMNDTIAIIATPLLIMIARENNLKVKPLLLGLAFSITLGSVLSPIGNPQNLLVATQGPLTSPFKSFIEILTIPTLICLTLCFLILFIFYRKTLMHKQIITHLHTHHLSKLSFLAKISISLMLLLIVLKIILEVSLNHNVISFSMIALISCAPIIIASQDRLTIMRRMDWHTIVFFISMFILMQSVWNSGVIQQYLHDHHIAITHTPTILLISALVSQIISNVPLVALYLPLLNHHHASPLHYLALAAGSTVAGNLFIVGAASNIIIIQNAEKRGVSAFSAWEFSRIGILLGVICLIVYWIFL